MAEEGLMGLVAPALVRELAPASRLPQAALGTSLEARPPALYHREMELES